MSNKSEKRLNFLTAYALISTVVFGFFIITSFDDGKKDESFDELTVKRINLVAEDGSLRMVLSNETRQHPGRMNGKDLEKRERPAGIIFFNELSDECGGLTYYGKTTDGITQSGSSFTMDQFKEDQVIQILNGEQYKDGKSQIIRGMYINDLPEGSDLMSRMKIIEDVMNIKDENERNKKMAEYGNSLSTKRRVFIGRTRQNSSGLFLSGPDGVQKIKIYVDENGNPKFEVLDEKGNSKNMLENK